MWKFVAKNCKTYIMNKSDEFTIIAYGKYANVDEAKNALQTPFIEDYVDMHGQFRQHNLEHIRVAKGVSLGELQIEEIAAETFEISCHNSHLPLNRTRIEELAEVLEIYDMFDEIEIKEKD